MFIKSQKPSHETAASWATLFCIPAMLTFYVASTSLHINLGGPATGRKAEVPGTRARKEPLNQEYGWSNTWVLSCGCYIVCPRQCVLTLLASLANWLLRQVASSHISLSHSLSPSPLLTLCLSPLPFGLSLCLPLYHPPQVLPWVEPLAGRILVHTVSWLSHMAGIGTAFSSWSPDNRYLHFTPSCSKCSYFPASFPAFSHTVFTDIISLSILFSLHFPLSQQWQLLRKWGIVQTNHIKQAPPPQLTSPVRVVCVWTKCWLGEEQLSWGTSTHTHIHTFCHTTFRVFVPPSQNKQRLYFFYLNMQFTVF